ncbi:MAG TPA: alpha/beta fold hydrolase [Dyella sp.]|uniref:alpha/beta fold hydrolase n=1 Tax=Dyella sp. TaxID=1869338 RepID=UPI002D7862AD|nr:alpha/beta fold hydrolase [Dyella sp.]HET6554221.1 alpha/beta fold hydrolase [Dyella sp.]
MSSMQRRGKLAGAVALAVLAVAGLSMWSGPGGDVAHAGAAFYNIESPQADGLPGSIIRMEPMDGAPLGASAWRVLYRSVGVHGEPIAVSGVIVIPKGVAPDGGRPIVAWAHPTSGVVPRCAPSEAHFVFQTMMGLRDMVRHGYIVAATDYPGLGTEGPHPYLVGDSEARAVIDIVRAARQMPGAQAGGQYAVWGHSQGGQAALFTGMLSGAYAPELKLVGVAAAAPATDLKRLLREDADTDGGRNVTAMTLWSWQRVYGAPIARVVASEAMPAVDALSNECIESVLDMVERHYSQRPLQQQFLSVKDITAIEPWKSLLAANQAGNVPANIPVLITQGAADRLVLPAVTESYVQGLCRAGSQVQYTEYPGVHHGFIGSDSAIEAVNWMTDRFAGKPAPSNCSGATP